MINVRIRAAGDAKAVHLCTWPATELDALIPTITRWDLLHLGVYRADEVSGQFVYDGNEAYFELLIGDPDDEES